jgi:hypothetical protein
MNIFEGILITIGSTFIIWFALKVKEMFNSRIKNEMIKINFNNIKFFIPAIIGFLVFVFEVLAYPPSNKILPLVDAIFLLLSIGFIIFNIGFVIIVGELKLYLNEVTKTFNKNSKRITNFNLRIIKVLTIQKESNSAFLDFASQTENVFTEQLLTSLKESQKNIAEILESITGNRNQTSA